MFHKIHKRFMVTPAIKQAKVSGIREDYAVKALFEDFKISF